MIRDDERIYAEVNDPNTVLASGTLEAGVPVIGDGNKGVKTLPWPTSKSLLYLDSNKTLKELPYNTAGAFVGTDQDGNLCMLHADGTLADPEKSVSRTYAWFTLSIVGKPAEWVDNDGFTRDTGGAYFICGNEYSSTHSPDDIPYCTQGIDNNWTFDHMYLDLPKNAVYLINLNQVFKFGKKVGTSSTTEDMTDADWNEGFGLGLQYQLADISDPNPKWYNVQRLYCSSRQDEEAAPGARLACIWKDRPYYRLQTSFLIKGKGRLRFRIVNYRTESERTFIPYISDIDWFSPRDYLMSTIVEIAEV